METPELVLIVDLEEPLGGQREYKNLIVYEGNGTYVGAIMMVPVSQAKRIKECIERQQKEKSNGSV